MKKILAILLILTVVFSSVPVFAQDTAGENEFTFSLNADGKGYTVTGYSSDQAESLVIPAEYNGLPVTAIGNQAFSWFMNLKRVVFPESLKTIGSNAFSYCNQLQDAVFPTSLENIGSYAFYYCVGLKSVDIPESVASIGACAFLQCSSLTSVKVPSSVTRIENGVFNNCYALEEVILPDTVNYIGESAFAGCTALSSITIPASVTRIENYTFSGCESLENVNLSSVTSIGHDAFNRCFSLKKILLPASISKIESLAFGYDDPAFIKSLEEIHFAGTKKAWDTVENQCPEAFLNAALFCSDGQYVYPDPDGLVFELDSDGNGYCLKDGTAYKGVLLSIPSAYNGLPVTKIGAKAFQKNAVLMTVIIPDTVSVIGDNAFYECFGLTSIELPSSLKNIGSNAFYCCRNVEKILLPENLESIGSGAFDGCRSLVSAEIPEGVSRLEDNTFYDCWALKNVSLPNTLTYIGSEAFAYCSDLCHVLLPHSVTSIAFGAFRGTSISDVYYIGTADEWSLLEPASAFDDYTNIRMHYVDDRTAPFVQKGGLEYQYDKDTDSYLILGIGEVNLAETGGVLKIPDTFTDGKPISGLGPGSFANNPQIREISLGSHVASVGSHAFAGCINLEKASLPGSLSFVGAYAFAGCKKLGQLSYNGTAAQWNGVEKGEYFGTQSGIRNAVCKDGQQRCDYEIYTVAGNFALLESYDGFGNTEYNIAAEYDGVPVTIIGEYAFELWAAQEIIRVPASVTKIEACAFGTDAIGFEGSTLKLVEFAGNAPEINKYAFQSACCDVSYQCDGSGWDAVVGKGFGGGLHWVKVHDLVPHDAKEPTCTEAGCEAYDTCSRCDYTTYKEIPAHGHKLIHVAAVAPTPKQDGNIEYWKCERCGKFFADAKGSKEIAPESVIVKYTAPPVDPPEDPPVDPPTAPSGDLNHDNEITDADAVYLLYHTFFPEEYPVSGNADYNKDGQITDADAVYLLYHTFFPEEYPL